MSVLRRPYPSLPSDATSNIVHQRYDVEYSLGGPPYTREDMIALGRERASRMPQPTQPDYAPPGSTTINTPEEIKQAAEKAGEKPEVVQRLYADAVRYNVEAHYRYQYSLLPQSERGRLSYQQFRKLIDEPGAVDFFSTVGYAGVFAAGSLLAPVTGGASVGIQVLAGGLLGLGTSEAVSKITTGEFLPSSEVFPNLVTGELLAAAGPPLMRGITRGIGIVTPEWVKDLVPTFRGSAIDRFLYENLPGYARRTGGLAKGIVSAPSIAYNIPELRGEIFDFSMEEGSSLLQTFKPAYAPIRNTPTFLGLGSDVFMPLATTWSNMYQYEYRNPKQPLDFVQNLEPKRAGFSFRELQKMWGDTSGEISLPKLVRSSETFGETIFPTITRLPSSIADFSLSSFGFSLLTGFRQPSRIRRESYSFLTPSALPNVRSTLDIGINPQPKTSVQPKQIPQQISVPESVVSMYPFSMQRSRARSGMRAGVRPIFEQTTEQVQRQKTVQSPRLRMPSEGKGIVDFNIPGFYREGLSTRKRKHPKRGFGFSWGKRAYPIMTGEEFGLYGLKGKGRR